MILFSKFSDKKDVILHLSFVRQLIALPFGLSWWFNNFQVMEFNPKLKGLQREHKTIVVSIDFLCFRVTIELIKYIGKKKNNDHRN